MLDTITHLLYNIGRKKETSKMSNKPRVYSTEAQALIETLKNAGEPLTLAEASERAGVEFKTGHLSSGRADGLIEACGEKEIEVSVKKSVKTYRYIGK
jgi:hypothetical protein